MAKEIHIIGLVLNIIWPGLGTLVNKKITKGLIQMFFFAFGLLLLITMFFGGAISNILFSIGFLGLIIVPIIYIWGIVDMIKLMKN